MSHVLIVDDRPTNRELLATVLGYYGHSVAQAADGELALTQVSLRRPDLVITDLLMPNMDGETLCRHLRRAPATSTLPIIIHTASYRARQARQIAQSLGVKWVLAKPSEPVEIISVVTEALGLPPPAAAAPPLLAAALPRAAAAFIAQGVVQDAAALAQQLASLVNLGLQMSWERDPDALAGLFCAAVQDILSARYAGVVILTAQGEVRRFISRGLDPPTHDAVAADVGLCPAAHRVLGAAGGPRMIVAAAAGDFTGLPAAHPAVQALLAAPVMTRDTVSGWLYAADRLGDEGFSADDERLALALGAVFATAWTSLLTLDEMDMRVAQRTRQLEAANAQLEAFSSGVSHDLRAPLGAIGGFAQALREKFGELLPPDAARYLGKIVRNVGVMNRLIDDLLHFARTSSATIHPCEVDLNALVTDCLETFQDEITRRGVAVTLGPLPSCFADPALLTQVLLNLVGNALKYTRHQPSPAIGVGSRVQDGETLFFVRDNGAGFDMGDAGELFTPFHRLHSSTEFEGSGIGLALVRQVIQRHGGRIWADAHTGQGACFTFTLAPPPASR